MPRSHRLTLRKDAYTVSALVEAGIPDEVAHTLVVDGPQATPERPRLSLTGRRRGDLTRQYVWGPDAETLLAEQRPS